jgi:hypothetical protein
MAQGDGAIFNTFKERVMEGVYNLSTGQDTIQTILVGAYTPDIDGDTEYGDVSGTEYNTGDGYTSGGETLAGQDVTLDTGNDRGVFDGTDETWTSLGPLTPTHPSYAVMYDGTPAGDPLIAYWEVSGTAPNGGNYTLQWGTNGIILLT